MWVLTFYADWCPYATALEHEILVNSRNMQVSGYNVKYGAVDVTQCPELVHRYQIARSPTIELYGTDKAHPVRYGGKRTYDALDRYVEEECTYFGYDKKAAGHDGYVTKIEYDVEACEADMDVYQADRLVTYEEILEKDMTHEANAYEMSKTVIVEAAEKQIQEIIAMRDETLIKEEVRHVETVEEAQAVYDMNVEEAIYEHEEVVKGLRDAYLKDMDLDVYIDTLEDKAYLAEIDAEDYKIEAKVEVTPEVYDECDECYDC